MKTENLSFVFRRVSEILSVDVTKFEVKGEKLRKELNLKYHKAFLVRYDSTNSSNPFPMEGINKITQAFRNQIIFQDLPRRDLRRNLTLTNGGNSFIFINQLGIPTPKNWIDKDGNSVDNSKDIEEFIEKAEKEKSWIYSTLGALDYSTIEQAEKTVSLNNYSWEQKEEVTVAVREVSWNNSLASFSPTYLRSKGDLAYPEDFLYFSVNTLESVRDGLDRSIRSKVMVLSTLLNLTPIVISSSKERYFSNSRHIKFTNELFQETISLDSSLDKLKLLLRSQSVKTIKDDYTYKNLLEYFPSLISDKFTNLESTIKASSSVDINMIIESVPQLRGYSFKDEWNTFRNNLLSEYILLVEAGISNWHFKPKHEKELHLNLYINSVQQFKLSQTKIPTRRRLKVERFKQNKNK